jgi:enamine deaminase RidA (YjgF/YER057c/UK114 family)
MKLSLLAPVLVAAAASVLSGCVMVSARETPAAEKVHPPAAPVVRAYASPTAAYAKSIIIPPGYETIRLPGIVADALPGGGFGDTEQQTESVLAKIAAGLAEVGASEADVVAATVFLAAPEGAATMDFDAMMRAWGKHYGTATQPNRPVRSTVEVAALVRPGMLVEIEVTAVRPAR